MLILLALVVVVISVLLWWLRDRYYTAPKEHFSGEIPTEEQRLGNAYSSLSPTTQREARETEIITPAIIESNYMEIAQQHQNEINRNETIVRQMLNDVTSINPNVPMEEQIRQNNTDPAIVAVTAAEEQQTRRNDFEQLLTTIDAEAKDTCFQTNCAPIQSAIQTKCSEFQTNCFYMQNYDIQRCLNMANSDCSTARMDTCRTTCNTLIDTTQKKSILKQGDILTTNQRLQSVSGSTVMILRDNGNLELYDNAELIWSSRTAIQEGGSTLNQNPYKLMIYPNGDMVIKNALNIEVWHTNTWMDAFDAGTANAPYQCVVGEKMIVLLNRNGKILWSSKTT